MILDRERTDEPQFVLSSFSRIVSSCFLVTLWWQYSLFLSLASVCEPPSCHSSLLLLLLAIHGSHGIPRDWVKDSWGSLTLLSPCFPPDEYADGEMPLFVLPSILSLEEGLLAHVKDTDSVFTWDETQDLLFRGLLMDTGHCKWQNIMDEVFVWEEVGV